MAEGWKNAGLLKGSGIPAPSGQYRVGCVDLMHQLAGDEKGGLLVRLTYPTGATPGAGYPYTEWVPRRAYIKGFLSLDRPPSAFDGFLSVLMKTFNNLRIPALDGAPLLDPDSKEEAPAPIFPVIVFSHGLGAMRTTYSAIVCDLASHGYVVAAVEHRDESAAACLQRVPKPRGREGELQDQWIPYLYRDVTRPKEDPVANAEQEFPFRNEQVKQRADEVGKALDVLTLLNEGAEIRNMMGGSYDFQQFKGRLDVSTAAVMGHSFGGATTIQTLSGDSRFKCGIALDCWMIPIASDIYSSNSSISQPLYFINSYTFQWRENMKRMLPMLRPVDDSGQSGCRVLTLKGTNHLSQSDVPFTSNPTIANLLKLERSELPSEVAHQVNVDLCRAFFKRHLLKDPEYQGAVPNLDGTEGCSEHILFGTNVKMSDSEGENGETRAGDGQEGVDKEEGQEGVANEQAAGDAAEGEGQDVAKEEEQVAEGEGQEGVAKQEYQAAGDAAEGEGQVGAAKGVANKEEEQEGTETVVEGVVKDQDGTTEGEGQEGVAKKQESIAAADDVEGQDVAKEQDGGADTTAEGEGGAAEVGVAEEGQVQG